jgi:RNA polymerase sigma factor (sigma-70 family)
MTGAMRDTRTERSGRGPAASSPGDLDDAVLLDRLRRGDGAAWEALWQRHYPWVRGWAASALRSDEDGEDVASETMLRTLVRFSAHPAPASLRAYLRTAAGNLVVDTVRSRVQRREIAERQAGDARIGGDEASDLLPEERRAVARALREMPDRQRYVLVRLVVDGLTVSEVAEEIAVTPNAASQLAFRARGTLRRLLGSLLAA